jgi:phospholipid/cholesterol/gamma-HCH transport system ATP-binding protein
MIAERSSIHHGRRGVEIRLEGVRKAFGDRVVLEAVDLEIRSGEMVALVGASGTGKTVLLDVMVGLTSPDTGTVLVADHSAEGSPLFDLNAVDWRQRDSIRLHWSLVFQRNALFTGTVYDNVALWLQEHTEMSERSIEKRIRDSLGAAALDVDDVLFKSRDELSGGMAKRVAIARAIATDPVVVFYDEPTTGLDPVISGQIHELIFDVHHRPRRHGPPRTSVIVTHDKDLLRRVRPRIIMLHNRRVAFDGPYDEFANSDLRIAEEYLRDMPVLHERGAEEMAR